MMEKLTNQLGISFSKMFDAVGGIFTGAKEFIVFIILTILAFNNIQLMLFVLVLLWVIDTVSAIYIQKNLYKKTDTKPEVYTMESNKLRDAGIKLVAYGCIILVSTAIVRLFYGGTITIVGTSESITGAELAVALCLFIEFWSILENAKKLGFDVIGRFKKAATSLWGAIRTAKGE